MPVPRQFPVAAVLAAASAALVPSVADAATLTGTVVGRPSVAGQRIVVPVLLSAGGEKAAGAALARVVVPRTGGLRAPNVRLKPDDLRIGDRVTAAVPRVTARPQARTLRITRRSATPSFARMDSQRTTVTAGVKRGIAQAQKIIAAPTSVLDPDRPAASNFELREQLRSVRTDLNLLIADLRTTGAGLDAAVTQIVASRPAKGARRAAVERQQAKVLAGLGADATSARDAAKALDDAVAELDEAMNAVGTPSAEPLPVEGVTAVSSVLYAILDLLRG
ncbi:hypothetical protein DSM112329_01060 [Paraconexibacter sp. AEG42_29]|uniref:DUF5667 domain-containing protein n=1 Tax=Paraconexibacter sp. AEG42_29 TaxID=2997339 RepID=A0AAU7ARA9_9ACTN